jgi:ubiquinone/menaquinone biosynthesis C-methylase UbiE
MLVHATFTFYNHSGPRGLGATFIADQALAGFLSCAWLLDSAGLDVETCAPHRARSTSTPVPESITERVAEYYDKNTAPFMHLGGSGVRLAAIHRQIWGQGVETRAQAFEYVNRYVLHAIQGQCRIPSAPARVLDLGCGLGGTMTWLAQRCEGQFTGITLSGKQCEWARRRAQALGLDVRCRFTTGDMTNTHFQEQFDVVYAIESLIHVADAATFFAEVRRVLAPGGTLVLADDFLSASATSEVGKTWLERFRSGWRAYGLRTFSAVQETAYLHGFTLTKHDDVSHLQRSVSPWSIHLANYLLQAPFLVGPYWDSLRGSTALQQCVRQGWIGYHLSRWTTSPVGRYDGAKPAPIG